MTNIKKQILFFTGAGSSAESGIPTFRKDNDALWNEYNIDDVCNIQNFIANKDMVFGFYNDMKKKYSHCEPNYFHHFVAQVQKKYPTKVFTSNIDLLLDKAGVKDVCHVHGSLNRMNCSYCFHTWELEDLNGEFFANHPCPNCQRYKYTKPGVIFFGEKAPLYEKLYDAFYEDKNSIDFNTPEKTQSLKIVVGASLNVISTHHLNINQYDNFGLSVLVDKNPSNAEDFNIVIEKKASEAISELNQIIENFMDY